MLKKLLKFIPALSFLALAPLMAYAQTTTCTAPGFGGILCRINELLSSLLPVLISLGVIYFVWGIVQYVIGGSEEDKKTGREKMLWGVIGLAVIISLWGLVNILVTTLDIGGKAAPDVSLLTPAQNAANSGAGCNFTPGNAKIQNLIGYIICLINDSVIPLIFALAVVIFVWGIVQFVINGDDAEKKAKGRDFMMWGIIGLTVMVSMWGLVNILGATFGQDTSFIPKLKTQQ